MRDFGFPVESPFLKLDMSETFSDTCRHRLYHLTMARNIGRSALLVAPRHAICLIAVDLEGDPDSALTIKTVAIEEANPTC